MFRAAFMSRSCSAPQQLHVHSLIPSPASPFGELADVAMERLTVDYWKGAPSKGWIYRRINEELAKIHTDDVEYTDIVLEENGSVCNSQCLEDVTFEVNRRLNEDERFVEAQTWHFKGED